jgi:hypothetical protein
LKPATNRLSYGTARVNGEVKQAISRALLAACFTLGLLFILDDGGGIFLLNVAEFHRNIRRYIPENRTLHKILNLEGAESLIIL